MQIIFILNNMPNQGNVGDKTWDYILDTNMEIIMDKIHWLGF